MGDTKNCPSCGQEIKAAATLCRFCGADFAVASPQPTAAPPPPPPPVPSNAVPGAAIPVNLVCECALVPYAGNASQFREARMRVENGIVTFTGKRLTPQGARKQRHSLGLFAVGPAGILALVGLGIALKVDDQTGGMLVITGFLFFLVMTVVWAVVFGRVWKTDAYTHTATFPTTQVANLKLGYNWGSFWGVSIFFSVLVGAIYLGVTGKNLMAIHAPLVPEEGVRLFKFTGKKFELARLTTTIAMWRSSQTATQPA